MSDLRMTIYLSRRERYGLARELSVPKKERASFKVMKFYLLCLNRTYLCKIPPKLPPIGLHLRDFCALNMI